MRGKAFELLDDIRYSTTKLTVVTNDGIAYYGTGFFFDFQFACPCTLLVTCSHVVEDWKTISFRVNKSGGLRKPLLGETEVIELKNTPEQKVLYHPDMDLCAFLIWNTLSKYTPIGERLCFRFLTPKHMPNDMETKYIGPIEEILMIGYPDGNIDKRHNLPLVRKGITATDFQLDYNGRKEFVIDAPIFEGSSGSPVFLCNMGGYSDQNGVWQFKSRLKLLGVLSEYGTTELHNIYRQRDDGLYELVKDMASTGINNLGYCVKAECLKWFGEEIKRRAWV